MAISTLYPSSRPSLSLDFAKSKRLDPRITFTRAQTGNTSSYIDSNGLIRYAGPDEPRFDHNPTTGESLGLLIEESRFNKTTYSDYSAVNLQNVSKSTTVSTSAPDGSSIFAFEANNNTSVTHRIVLTNGDTGSATTPHTASFFAKIPPIGSDQISSSETIKITLRWRSSSGSGTGAGILYNQSTQQYDIYTGVNGFGANAPTRYDYTQGYIVDYPNGWKRFVFPNAVASTNSNESFGSYDWNITETDAEQGGNCTVFLWGAQFEQSTFVTSYIPTSGGGTTRPADRCKIDSSITSEFKNDTEMTMVSKVRSFCSITQDNMAIGFNEGTSTVRGLLVNIFGNGLNLQTRVGNSSDDFSDVVHNSNGILSLGDWAKTSLAYKDNIGYHCHLGQSVVQKNIDTSYLFELTNLNIGDRYPDTSPLNGHINQISFYTNKISNSQLQTLTK